MRNCGVPVNLARRSSRCVAMPVGQVFKWHCRAISQPNAYERLLRLCQPALPGDAGVLDRLKRRGARPTIMPADLDIISVRFCHTSGDRANANACNEFDANMRPWVDLLQVIDQLSNVFDAVNIVMRRRRDQWHMW